MQLGMVEDGRPARQAQAIARRGDARPPLFVVDEFAIPPTIAPASVLVK